MTVFLHTSTIPARPVVDAAEGAELVVHVRHGAKWVGVPISPLDLPVK